jgi:hypothetical protein
MDTLIGGFLSKPLQISETGSLDSTSDASHSMVSHASREDILKSSQGPLLIDLEAACIGP